MKKTSFILFLMMASAFCLMTSCVKEKSVGSIQGFVNNAVNGEPIQGVNISLSPTGLSAVTGSDGRYEFINLEPGQYTVQGVKQGYASNTKNITIVAGNVSSGDMMLTPEVAGFRLNVEYLDFQTNFNQLSFKIINTSTSLPVSWNITESMAWLQATPSSGNLQAGQEVAVMVTIDRSQIEQSTTANLSVVAGDQTVVLPVNVTVSGSQGPQLQLSETSLDFGVSATNLAFYVMNTGPAGTSLNWTCSNINVDWLTITPTSGNTDGGSSTAVMATVDRDKIDGVVSTSVTVSGAGSSATLTISAASQGSGAAILQLSEGSLDFGESETTKTFMVKNVGSTGTVLDWNITTPNVDWLTLSPMLGNTNAGSGTQVTAVVDRNKINGQVSTTVTVNGANNSANLNVSAACFHPAMQVSTTSIDFGTESSSETLTITNTGDQGSTLNWNVAAPSVNWLTVSPMSGSTTSSSSSTVTLTVDRSAFVGVENTNITITGAGSTTTVSITVDNSMVVTNGLVAYYSFDDGNVTDWNNAYNGFNQGALASTDTPSGEGKSMEFDGTSSYLQIPYNLLGSNVWSYSMWFKTTNSNAHRTFFATNNSGKYMGFNTEGKLVINPNQSWTTSGALTSFFNNQWHMLTITYNGSVVNLYLDGLLFEVRQDSYFKWFSAYTGTFIGGNMAQSNHYFYNGKLDNIRTYNRALTADEVRILYNAKQ